jgi:hypothetical protein
MFLKLLSTTLKMQPPKMALMRMLPLMMGPPMLFLRMVPPMPL